MRYYKCVFVSELYDVATTTGVGNTRRTAEKSARRKLPRSKGHLKWTLRSIDPVLGGFYGR